MPTQRFIRAPIEAPFGGWNGEAEGALAGAGGIGGCVAAGRVGFDAKAKAG